MIMKLISRCFQIDYNWCRLHDSGPEQHHLNETKWCYLSHIQLGCAEELQRRFGKISHSRRRRLLGLRSEKALIVGVFSMIVKSSRNFVWHLKLHCHLVEGVVDEEEEGTVELHHLARTHAEHECWRGRRRLGPFLRNLKQFFCGIMSMITFIRFLWSSCLQNYFILAFTFCFPVLCSIFRKYVWVIRKIHYLFWDQVDISTTDFQEGWHQLTLRTALCCSVSSRNSFHELVIGEKSLDGLPENNLFIPRKYITFK